MKEETRFWRTDDAGPVDWLKATYYTHRYCRHTHDDYVFGVIVRGGMSVNQGHQKHPAEAGRLVILNPGDVHWGHALIDIGWSYRTLYPSADLIHRIASSLKGSGAGMPGFSRSVIRDPRLAADFLAMHRLQETSPSALEREEAFQRVMRTIIGRWSDCELPSAGDTAGEPRAVRLACSWLSERYRDNPTLSELAESVGLSPWYLTRVFTRTKGLPPHAWLNQYRVGRARDLLRKGVPLSRAAAETGFTDQSHMTRHFRKQLGITPGAMRQGKNVQY